MSWVSPIGATNESRTNQYLFICVAWDMAAVPLVLNCWVEGDSISQGFSVSMMPDSKIVDLREEIKREVSPRFASIPANDIEIWLVDIEVNQLSHSPFEKKSVDSRFVLLSPLFPLINPFRVHVVVGAPSRKLYPFILLLVIY
jgi:hypothetical protein